MSQQRQVEFFTYELTNDSITITGDEGVTAIAIYNGSATAGSVLGNRKLGSVTPTANAIEQYESWSQVIVTDGVVAGITIAAPAGCTLQIVCQF